MKYMRGFTELHAVQMLIPGIGVIRRAAADLAFTVYFNAQLNLQKVSAVPKHNARQ